MVTKEDKNIKNYYSYTFQNILFIEYIEHFSIFEGPVYVPKYPPTGWVTE
jgi:hypothetical protein